MEIPGAPQAGLPSPSSSRAVLVGVSEYADLPGLPAVANNLATLRRVLTDADLWGLPDEHCVTLFNPTSVEQVLDAVHTAATAAEDALLFYFAGHGLLDDDRFDLHLALPSSDTGRLYRAVRYDDVRRAVVGATRAPAKVVILDCCFSGRALQGGMSGTVDLADHARVDGTYLMTATAETKLALAPPGEEYTAFTGALLDKLQHGLPNGPDLLDMETLFYHVRADLQARRLPVPQQRTRNDGKAIALVRNRRGGGRAAMREFATRPRELPQPPAGFDTVLRQPPRELAKVVGELRESGRGDTADQLLAASAALRPDQEVAAIVDLLRLAQRSSDLRQVITAAASRPPAEVLDILDTLRDLDLPAQARQLLVAVAAGQADDVAGLARLLQVQQRKEDLEMLLDAALDTAQERAALIGLVNTLWVAGLREEVDGLIDRAVSKLPGSAVADLADELRAVGREEAAFGLYTVAAEWVARRPPEAAAELCHVMTSAGRTGSSDKVAKAMINAAGGVHRFLDVMVAFWDADQDDYAEQARARAAATLSVVDVVALAAELRARSRDEAAFRLCSQAAVGRSANEIHEIVSALREAGRPVDANKLLAAVAEQAPVRTVVTLLDRFAEADRRRVLTAVVEREPQDVAELLDTLGPGHALTEQLSAMIATSADNRTQLLPVMVRQLDPPSKEQLFAGVVDTRDGQEIADLLRELPADDARCLMFLAVKRGNPTLESVIDALGSGADEPVYLLGHPTSRFGQLVDGLRRAGFDRYADAVLREAAGQKHGDEVIAGQVALLYATGRSGPAAVLLDATLAGRKYEDLEEFIDALRRQNQTEALAGAASWVRTTYARNPRFHINSILRHLGLSEFVDRRRGRASD